MEVKLSGVNYLYSDFNYIPEFGYKNGLILSYYIYLQNNYLKHINFDRL